MADSAAVSSTAQADTEHRSGERTLGLLSTPLNLSVLRALAERPMRLAELRQATGLPAQTTLRGHLGGLERIGAVAKQPTRGMPYAIENELTMVGEELLDVAESLALWLQRAPLRPVRLDSGEARGIVKAFVDGWGSRMVSTLATRPMSLTELDREIAEFSYPALERRFSSMRMAGLIEPRPGTGSGTPYELTEWARLGVRPLTAALRCERLRMPERAAPITKADIESALLMATPLVNLGEDSSGTCQLQVKVAQDDDRESGVRVEMQRGKVVACASGHGETSVSYAIGTTTGWLTAMEEGAIDQLRFGGGGELAEQLVRGMHLTLRGPWPPLPAQTLPPLRRRTGPGTRR